MGHCSRRSAARSGAEPAVGMVCGKKILLKGTREASHFGDQIEPSISKVLLALKKPSSFKLCME